MRVRTSLTLLAAAGALACLGMPLSAQAGSSPHAAPRGQEPARGAQWTPPLERLVSLNLRDVPLEEALAAIDEQAGLGLSYTPRVVPVSRRVTVRGENLSVAEALRAVLMGTGVQAVMSAAGTVMLVRRAEERSEQRPRAEVVAGIVGGRVRDAATGRPLEYVAVSIIDSMVSVSTHTNDSGIYVLRDVPPGEHTIRVRLIGFKPSEQTVVVPDRRLLNVDFALEITGSRLQEVVSTATGARRKLELGSDITVIDADSIVRTQPITSVTDLLEGRVPGMIIQRTSGAPGDPARIRLRGAASPNLSNDPIVIVDGVRVYSEQSGDRGGNLANTGTQAYAAPSPLDYIDPNSIETIEVIKGPSAATLYGQDAANGVIVVTTKKGRAGPTRWTMSAERGMTEMVGDYPELMLRWGHILGDDAVVFCPINNSASSTNGSVQLSGVCVADSTVRFQMLNDPELTVLDQGSRAAATVGVSGGSDALTYNVTGSYRDELGLVRLPTYEAERYRAETGRGVPNWMRRPQELTQWGASSRLSARIGSTADVSLSANLSRTSQQRSELERQLGSLMSTYLDRATGVYWTQSSGSSGRITANSAAGLTDYHERATAVSTQFRNGANLNWRPLSWLTTSADAGIDVVQRADEVLIPRGFGSGSQVVGQLSTGKGTSLMSTVNVRALAGIPVGRGFKLQLATGVNYTGQSVDDLSIDADTLQEGTEAPFPNAKVALTRRYAEQATFGWYIEPSINHRRFWLSTGLRLDGGSSFGTRVRLPAFPKLSLSYLLSDEPFFPWKELVPVLRLRAAYGQAGRQPGPVDRLRLYGSTALEYVDDEYVEGVQLDKLGNTKLEPERTEEIEGGFDADLLDDRLTLSFTGYRKTTTDAMMNVPVAPSVYGGAVTRLMNIGVVRNEGLEASVGARLVRTDPVMWDVNVAVSQQRNEVIELGPGVEPFYAQSTALVSGGTRVAAGYPLFGRWTRPLLGYADADRDGVLETEELLYGDTAVFVGGTLPNYTANLHTTFRLFRGALAVGASFLYEDGMTQKNEVGQALAPFTPGWNNPDASLDEQLTRADTSDYSWIQTVNTLRFNSLSVTYNIPSHMAQRVGARALSLSLQGSNLGIRTNYRGIDPNVNAFSTGNAVTDTGVLPRPRTWQLRLNATY